jgi:hypothetical protein
VQRFPHSNLHEMVITTRQIQKALKWRNTLAGHTDDPNSFWLLYRSLCVSYQDRPHHMSRLHSPLLSPTHSIRCPALDETGLLANAPGGRLLGIVVWSRPQTVRETAQPGDVATALK